MARKVIDVGAVGNDGTGDSIRDSFRKVNDNFRELYSSLGLGDRLTFINLDDTPSTFVGNENAVMAVNQTTDGLIFKQITGGTGITIDNTTEANQIILNAEFSSIQSDPSPQLGGNLSVQSGGNTYRILDLLTPTTASEAANKEYVDTKIARAGVNAIDPRTGTANPTFGTMTGPLILARNPEPDDDEIYDGKIAATKEYVDNSAFGSSVNLYVATSGSDERPGTSEDLQGRALAYAYRSIEAALKKAEEIMLESLDEVGPYEKTLTFNEGAGTVTLADIDTSPISGSGFVGTPSMSVATIELNSPGQSYQVGDRVFLFGGTGDAAEIEVLSTVTNPGAIRTFRVVSTGNYTALPGSTAVPSDAPQSQFGSSATFDVTYSVNGVQIQNGGSGYSLVSVRIYDGTGDGTGAFGTATVVGGVITEIEVTDGGSGFTTLPTVQADLPRFLLRTDGFRTDATGDVINDTPEAFQTRDMREGLFLKGVESGALAQVVSHGGDLDSNGNEIFDVDIKYGTFQLNEPIAYGDVAFQDQITIKVESGIYYENYPLRVPPNVSIVGDEFRRTIIRPRAGTSSSPWAFIKFRRDTEIDGLTIASQQFGYHYLQDGSQPVYPKIDNGGGYKAAAELLRLNKEFIQDEVVGWIENEIADGPGSSGDAIWDNFSYDSRLCKRDVGSIIDAMKFDLRYGEYNRTISAGLKYYQSASGRKAITDQLAQTTAALRYAETLIIQVIQNNTVSTTYGSIYPQIIDPAYVSQTKAQDVVGDLFDTLIDVIDGSGSVNYPKENDQMDVFMANDAVRWQAISCQGHGGFMLTLDPTGQILAKSPYAQECASFSKSINKQTFAGGMFVDGFSGNLEFKIVSKDSNTRLRVEGLDRFPQLPASFIVDDQVYRINYVRDYTYTVNGATATLVLDETTPWTFPVFQYDDDICSRDVGLIIDGLGYDIVLGTNYHARKAGLTYRQSNAAEVVENQLSITIDAIDYAHELAKTYTTGVAADINNSNTEIATIIRQGAFFASDLTFTNPPGLATNLVNARTHLENNLQFIKDEVVGYINTTYPSLTYDSLTCARDTQYIIEALIHDLIYGGNWQTVDAGLKYYDGVGAAVTDQLPGYQKTETVAGIDYAKYLAKQVIVGAAPAVSYSATPQDTSASNSDSTVQAEIETLLSNTSDIVANGVGSADPITYPDLATPAFDAADLTARTDLQTAKTTIQSAVIDYVDDNGNKYEILMPGNRSMLSNDFTQVNDLGYGLLATNGGLTEAVSMFTYYCHVSYFSLNGAQIRSVAGSSAHGNYALVADGADPLEVPTPVTLYYDLAQRVDCYAPGGQYVNTQEGLFIYVTNYSYTPLNNSELEIDHGNLIYRYPVTSVSTEGTPDGVARLNLTSDDSGNFDGLYDAVPDGTVMSIRSNSQVVLTGDVVDVATRPSTGLKLKEFDDVYRILTFEEYDDSFGNREAIFTAADPTVVRLLEEITDINGTTNVATTSRPHRLRRGDMVTVWGTGGYGLVSGNNYYVIDVPNYNEIQLSTSPGGSVHSLTTASGISLKLNVPHNLLANYILAFESTGTLPDGVEGDNTPYYVLSNGLTSHTFRMAPAINGTPVANTTTGTGTISAIAYGLARTTLRENYNYVDLTVYRPGQARSGTTQGCTFDFTATPTEIVTSTGHGMSVGDPIVFTVTTGGALPTGLSATQHYFVNTIVSPTRFTISEGYPGVTGTIELELGNTGSGTFSFYEPIGDAGEDTIAVVPVAPDERSRVPGTRFVFKGEEYIISSYESEDDTGEVYARIVLNRPLEHSIQKYEATYSIKSAVAARSTGSTGTLTIRISLTRVTGHDLLEIGTGGYADTNYPNEIYGPPVRSINQARETEERDVGRVFYVTTDQFGNFRVGPYFTVDQGTGQVTFAAAIALSNLDGIGFKRGVPVSEFSIDGTFADNAVDTVPTENAVRKYIEARLGKTHGGAIVPSDERIPSVTGGFMALDGSLEMSEDMSLGNNRIVSLADPLLPTDGVNLRSLTFTNLQEFDIQNLEANDILVFTGDGNNAINASVVGDIALSIDSTANTIDAQIVPEIIENADIAPDAAIVQSKLDLQLATTSGTAPTGTPEDKQAGSGLTSYNSAEFTVTDGWVELKSNSIVKGKLEVVAAQSVIGNNTGTAATAQDITFSTVVDVGGSIKKNQYSATGFLRRKNTGSNINDADYEIIETSAAYTGASDNNKLINRDSNGDFGARVASLSQLKIDTLTTLDTNTTATGGAINLYTYNGSGGIRLGSGSLATDKTTYYDNDYHEFRTQNGASAGTIKLGTLQTTAITTGANTTAGTITGRWTLTGSAPNESRFEATYSADVAEYYEGDKEYEVGTVLVFGGEKEVTTTTKYADARVAGVVSNTAAYVMYTACPGEKNLVALTGRVPCKVVGKIKKGDIIVTSEIPGVGVKAIGDVRAGTIIGKAIEDHDSDEVGTIEVAVGRT